MEVTSLANKWGRNKNLFLWIYYDFANSVAFIVVSFYFPLYLVQERQAPDYLIALTAALSTVILLATLPILGQIADKRNQLVLFLKLLTITSIFTLFIEGLAIYYKASIILILLAHVLFLYVYQASLSFYNALINNNQTNQTKEKVSGLGLAAGQLGNAVGLSIILPLAGFFQPIFNISIRELAIILSGFTFLIMMLPFLSLYKLPQSKLSDHAYITISLKSVLEILKNKSSGIFLLSFFFFADAILTLTIYASLILEKMAFLNDKEKTITFLIGLAFAVIGGIFVGKIAKSSKSIKSLITKLIFASGAMLIAVALTHNRTLLQILIIIFSLLYGVLFSLTRTFYYDLIPQDKKGQYFSAYTLFERLASILGPTIWTITFFLTASLDEPTRYRFALVSLALLSFIGGAIFTKIKAKTDII